MTKSPLYFTSMWIIAERNYFPGSMTVVFVPAVIIYCVNSNSSDILIEFCGGERVAWDKFILYHLFSIIVYLNPMPEFSNSIFWFFFSFREAFLTPSSVCKYLNDLPKILHLVSYNKQE